MAHELAEQFRETGVVRIDGAFTSAEASAIHAMVWRQIEARSTVRRADPDSWAAAQDGSFGLGGLGGRPEFWAVVGNTAVGQALDVIFGPAEWRVPRKVQVLLTFPQPGRWVMPTGWHIDFGFTRPTWPVFAVKVFSFFDEVRPKGGGTLVLEGSHRLVERFAATDPPTSDGAEAEDAFVPSYPWLAELTRGGTEANPRSELIGESHEVDGVPLRVVELTGAPGDVVITHMHVMHSPSRNTGETPRQMLGLEIPRAEKQA